jgi:hypothetical protein
MGRLKLYTPAILQARQAYQVQAWHAVKRGLKMELTFEEWYDIWQASGHWEERGRKANQYVMSRHNDQGNYALGNVSIKQRIDNSIEGCRKLTDQDIEDIKRNVVHGFGGNIKQLAEQYSVHPDTIRNSSRI